MLGLGLEKVFVASRDLVLALDAQGVVTYRNPAAIARALDLESSERLTVAARAVAATGEPQALEWGEIGPSGVRAWFSTELTPIIDGVLAISRDVTQMRHLNAELEARVRQRTAELETAMADLGAFTSMVSHDLRAPMTVVQMSADLLTPEVAASPKNTASVDRIHRALKNMRVLMDDLRAFALVGEVAMQPQLLDVSAMATEIVTHLLATNPGHDVVVRIEPGLTCVADPQLFRSLLANLISNGCKYTTKQSLPRVEVGRTERDGVPVLLVRDNGIGFDPKDAVHLFEPFARLKNSLQLPGTGLGLAIVKKIADRHRGTVEADSSLGAGATFYVRMPGLT